MVCTLQNCLDTVKLLAVMNSLQWLYQHLKRPIYCNLYYSSGMTWPFPEMNPSKMHNQNIVPLFDNFYPRWRISRFENSRFEKFLNKNGILHTSNISESVMVLTRFKSEVIRGQSRTIRDHYHIAGTVSFKDMSITWCHVTSSYLTITLVGSNRMESGLARQNNLS